jgi:hypothetical protein
MSRLSEELIAIFTTMVANIRRNGEDNNKR